MEKYKNKYRIPSARLQGFDYSRSAAYFITICTHNREHYFGEINDGELHLNDIGKIVAFEWLKTIELRPDMNLELGNFVVMPNHFHAVIIIGENQFNTPNMTLGRDAMLGVSDSYETTKLEMHDISNANNLNQYNLDHNHTNLDAKHGVSTGNKFGPQSKNLASIVRGFKSAVTMKARNIHADFAWQTRFHDHIIRNDEEFERVHNYIVANPQNWEKDMFYSNQP